MSRQPRKGSSEDWKEELWERRLAELTEFREKHGHNRVPARWRSNEGLGRWLAHQRELERSGELRADRRKRLMKLGSEWLALEPHYDEHDRYMEQMLARLAAFREKHGHDKVTREEDYALARWMTRQRTYRKNGTLKRYRREQMDAAGFPWGKPDFSIEAPLRRLMKFQESFGHTQVPSRWPQDCSLGRWVAHQRALHRAGKLPAERRHRLEAIGFEWSVSSSGGPKPRSRDGSPS